MDGITALRILLGPLALVLLGSTVYSLVTGKTYLCLQKGLGTLIPVYRASSPARFWVTMALSVALGVLCLLATAGVFGR